MSDGKSSAIKYSKRQNIIDARFDNLEKTYIREILQGIDSELKLYQIDYKSNPSIEARGWDILGRRGDKEFGIQVKIRRPKWWNKRGIDFPIEIYDGNRPGGKGWFPLYQNQNIEYMIFVWRGPESSDKYFTIYDNKEDTFFESVSLLKSQYDYKPFEVQESGMDGIYRSVGGFILPLSDIEDILLYDSEQSLTNCANKFWKAQGWN